MNAIINQKVKTGNKEVITSVRLPFNTRIMLNNLARVRNKTMSEIIVESLDDYLNREENELSSYELGLQYFGKYSSGEGDLSVTYKERIKEKLRARQNSY